MPALIDPGLTVMQVLSDGETGLMGQYLWRDAPGAEPGFRLDVNGEDLQLTGPLSLDDVHLSLLDALALGSVASVAPVRLVLSAEQLFAVAALADTYIGAAARRRLSRIPGPPPGFLATEIVAAWLAGISHTDPGWSVSLLAMLNPDAVPQRFDQRLPGVMKEMADDGMLGVLAGEPGDPLDEIYVIGEELDLLCRSLAAGATNFGLAVQRRTSADRVEAMILGGWRTAGGIWLADLSALPDGNAELSLYDPRLFIELLKQVYGSGAGQSGESTASAVGHSLESILAQLKESSGLEVNAAATSPVGKPVESVEIASPGVIAKCCV